MFRRRNLGRFTNCSVKVESVNDEGFVLRLEDYGGAPGIIRVVRIDLGWGALRCIARIFGELRRAYRQIVYSNWQFVTRRVADVAQEAYGHDD